MLDRRSLLLLLAVTAGALTDAAGAESYGPGLFREMRWRMIGPHRGGRTKAAAGIPDRPGVFYIGVCNGGVWKTDDYGRTWAPIFDDQPTGSIGALAIAASNPDVIYVGSGEGLQRPDLSTGDGIYKSTDAGKTWSHLGLRNGRQIPQIAVDPADPDRLAPLPPPPEESREVLFLGDLQFGPNITGLEWFLRECWGDVRAAVPDAKLRIVGRGLSEQNRATWAGIAGVEIVGFTTDIRGEYARAACTIAPIHWGGGTKIKVVESAALGRVCVATPHALRGFEPLAEPPSPCVLVAATAEHFAAAVVDLLRSPFHRGELGLNGPVMVQRGYTLAELAATVHMAVARAAPRSTH